MDSGVTCKLGTRGCYFDHDAYDYGVTLMSIPGYTPQADMIDIEGRRIGHVFQGVVHCADSEDRVALQLFVPDPKNPATRGVMLEQLRDFTGNADLSLVHQGKQDGVWTCSLVHPTKTEMRTIDADVGLSPLDAEIRVMISAMRRAVGS